jgi:hypothetical protein
LLVQPAGDVVTFVIDRQETMAAAGADDERGAIRFSIGRKERRQRRFVNAGNVVFLRARDFLVARAAFGSGRVVRPEWNGDGRRLSSAKSAEAAPMPKTIAGVELVERSSRCISHGWFRSLA